MENSISARIYSIDMDRRLPAFAGPLGVLMGGAFLVWYALGISSAAAGDIRNFPASLHSSPMLTIIFTILKLGAYIFFPYIAATWVYAPLRDSIAKKQLKGELREISDFPGTSQTPLWARVPPLAWFLSWGMPVPGRSAMKSIRLTTGEFHVPDAPVLSQILSRENMVGSEVTFCLGAFNRVLSIDLKTGT